MPKKSVTIIGAWIGFAAIILSAIIYAIVEIYIHQSGSTVSNPNQIHDNQQIEELDVAKRTTRLDFSSRELLVQRNLNIRSDSGSSIEIGHCPYPPCFHLQLRKVDLHHDPPLVEIAISGIWEGISLSESSPAVIMLHIKKGCGFTVNCPDYDLIFEITNDQVSDIKGTAAILGGTYKKNGMYIKEMNCP